MLTDSSATVQTGPALPLKARSGLFWGFIGVAAFSFTVPCTRVAVRGLHPAFVGSGRAVIAGVLAAIILLIAQQPLPSARQAARLGVVGGGVILGFPMLTSIALVTVPAAHAAVVIAFLPAATAVLATVRAHERPPARFWAFALAGALTTGAFLGISSGGLGHWQWADLLLIGAVLVCAVGYAEGGLLSREIGSWQTISWALVLYTPLMATFAVRSAVAHPPHATWTQWTAFGYLGLVSALLGFFAWYRGLAIGPMVSVSQVQLIQPLLTLTWAFVLLGEPLSWLTIASGMAVIVFAAGAVRVRLAA